jgi:hypothetical protein
MMTEMGMTAQKAVKRQRREHPQYVVAASGGRGFYFVSDEDKNITGQVFSLDSRII